MMLLVPTLANLLALSMGTSKTLKRLRSKPSESEVTVSPQQQHLFDQSTVIIQALTDNARSSQELLIQLRIHLNHLEASIDSNEQSTNE